VSHGLIFLTSAHGRQAPIYAVRLTASGRIDLGSGPSNEHVAWSYPRQGSYMQTPLVAGDEVYFCNDAGVLSCYDARTGTNYYRERLGGGRSGFTASLVAADGKLYATSEVGAVYVVRWGKQFEVLAKSELGESCLATPAISAGTIYFRGQHHLFAIGR
jgi:outer membrane protein assembly factor BamB